MAGHSKWKNILHKKGKTDAQRAKLFTKLSREIIVAVREGGPDPSGNSRLRDAIAKARAGNVPADNVKRVIERAAGSSGGDNYERVTYEGYGPSGVAVIVEAMTDNRNRTASDVRHYFDKYGGNLGASGCVSWSFDRKGVLIADAEGRDEDGALEAALEYGAEDFSASDGVFEIITAPEDFGAVRDALEKLAYVFLSAEIEMVPQNRVALSDPDDVKKFEKLLELLEDNDDVQSVWHNWEA
ncbi:MAG: YebC/PmpR family DNA-binding transcriptional regulator [Oscillospiraceae bacterium]|nr:YebC/PmpR family DNA-binding transcriptional regulator [Oscillospiraceae bacterium]